MGTRQGKVVFGACRTSIMCRPWTPTAGVGDLPATKLSMEVHRGPPIMEAQYINGRGRLSLRGKPNHELD